MDETFNTNSVELSRDRGHIEPDELLRLRIVCESPLEKLHDGSTGTEQHIMIHDRWREHVKHCDICKEHVMTLILDLSKRIDLFSPTMIRKLMNSATPDGLKRAMEAVGPEAKERMKTAVGG